MAKTSTMAYRNWAWESGVTITASSAATGYPASNLGASEPWKIWRSTVTTGDQWVKFDLGTSRALAACFLRNVLIHTGGSVRFQANATDSWGSPTINTAFTIPSTARTRVLSLLFASQSLRWVRILFVNTGAVSQAVELGVAFPTSPLTMSVGVGRGVTLARADLSLHLVSIGGQRQVDRRSQQFSLQVDPNALEETERDQMLALFDTVGTFLPWFLMLDTVDQNLCFYGRIIDGLPVQHLAETADAWSSPFVFQEEL